MPTGRRSPEFLTRQVEQVGAGTGRGSVAGLLDSDLALSVCGSSAEPAS